MPDTLPALLMMVQEAIGPSRELDARIEIAVRRVEQARREAADSAAREPYRVDWRPLPDGRLDAPIPCSTVGRLWDTAPPFTRSTDAAVALVERILPGWWWKFGTCCVSDDACIAPDFNSRQHGRRLEREFFPLVHDSEFDAGFDVDRRPPGNVPLALLESLLRALIAINERTKGAPNV